MKRLTVYVLTTCVLIGFLYQRDVASQIERAAASREVTVDQGMWPRIGSSIAEIMPFSGLHSIHRRLPMARQRGTEDPCRSRTFA